MYLKCIFLEILRFIIFLKILFYLIDKVFVVNRTIMYHNKTNELFLSLLTPNMEDSTMQKQTP